MKVCICYILIVSRSSEGGSFAVSSKKLLRTLILKLLLSWSSLQSYSKLSTKLSLIDLITLPGLWCAFKPPRSLHRFAQKQLIYFTFETDLLLIISGLTTLFELALILATLLLLELWCDLEYISTYANLNFQNLHQTRKVNTQKSIISHLDIISQHNPKMHAMM